MTIKNGDLPAMPVWCANSDQQLYGLTKREMLAMAAMQGLCANIGHVYEKMCRGGIVHRDYLAGQSVLIADALLEELERTK